MPFIFCLAVCQCTWLCDATLSTPLVCILLCVCVCVCMCVCMCVCACVCVHVCACVCGGGGGGGGGVDAINDNLPSHQATYLYPYHAPTSQRLLRVSINWNFTCMSRLLTLYCIQSSHAISNGSPLITNGCKS